MDIGDVATIFAVFVLLPLSIFRSKRTFAGRWLKFVAFILFLDLWAYALGVIWNAWGLVAVIIGVIFTPLVASIIAIIASVSHRDWLAALNVVIYIAMTMGAYLGADAIERRA